MEADLFSQTSSALSLQTWRGVLTSLQTCLETGWHLWLLTTEHCCSLISLVWMLGTRLQTRRLLGRQSWVGTSWQCSLLSTWQSSLGTWRHWMSGTSLHSCLGKERHCLEVVWEHCDTLPWGRLCIPPWGHHDIPALEHLCTARSSEPSHRFACRQCCTPWRRRCCILCHRRYCTPWWTRCCTCA